MRHDQPPCDGKRVCSDVDGGDSRRLTVHKALENQNSTQDVDFAHVLQRCGSDPLYVQLLELTTIIEALGGTTSYSDEDLIDAQVAEVLGGGREEGGNHE